MFLPVLMQGCFSGACLAARTAHNQGLLLLLPITALTLLHLLLHLAHLLLALAHLFLELLTLLFGEDLFHTRLEQNALGRHLAGQIAQFLGVLADRCLVVIRADLPIQRLLKLLDLLLGFLNVTLHFVQDAANRFLLLIGEINHFGELIHLIALRLTRLLRINRKRHCQCHKGCCKESDRLHRTTPDYNDE
mgnify:CR=1 FL=1